MKSKIYSIALLFIVLLWGCEKNYDNVIETQATSYLVTSVFPKDTVKFNLPDSLVTIKITFSAFSDISSVYCNLFDSDNLKINSSSLFLFDNGEPVNGDETKNDGRYSNRFPLSTYYPSGNYYVKYFVTDRLNQTRQIATASFVYDNGQPNSAPILSEILMPDSIETGRTFTFSVKAKDPNGYRDIKRVYFQLYRPDSSLVVGGNGVSKFNLDDSGNLSVFGDELPGDGIFSYKNSFSATAQKGFWLFEFEAEDRAGLLSNKITKSIKVL